MRKRHLSISPVSALSFDVQCTKRIMQFADNIGPDQSAHMRRLIRTYVVCLQNQWILKYMLTNRNYLYQTAPMFMLIWTVSARTWHKGFFHMLCIICFFLHPLLFFSFLFSSSSSVPFLPLSGRRHKMTHIG